MKNLTTVVKWIAGWLSTDFAALKSPSYIAILVVTVPSFYAWLSVVLGSVHIGLDLILWSLFLTLIYGCAFTASWITVASILQAKYEIKEGVARVGKGYTPYAQKAQKSILITHADDDWPDEDLLAAYAEFLSKPGTELRRIIYVRRDADPRSYEWIARFGAEHPNLPNLKQWYTLPRQGHPLPFSFAVIDEKTVLVSVPGFAPADRSRGRIIFSNLIVIECKITAQIFGQIFEDLLLQAIPVRDPAIFASEANYSRLYGATKIRRATKSDRSAILNMSIALMNSPAGEPKLFDEYILNNIDEWIANCETEKGIFFVGEQKEELVACINISKVSEVELVLEGVRVSRRWWNKGIALEMGKTALKAAHELKPAPVVVRCVVDSDNPAGQEVARKLKFKEIAQFRALYGPASSEPRPDGHHPGFTVRLATTSDNIRAWKLVDSSSYFAALGKRLVMRGWRPRELNSEHLNKMIESKTVFVIDGPNNAIMGIVAYWKALSEVRTELRTIEIPLLIAPDPAHRHALIDALRQHLRGEAEEFLFLLPEEVSVQSDLRSQGFNHKREHTDLIFEKGLRQSPDDEPSTTLPF